MATSQLTPLTPLLARMRSLPASRAQRLRLADELAADTTPLVMDMLASVQVLDGFDGGEEAFTGERPDIVCDLGEVAHRERGLRTADFAFWLAARGHLAVMLEPQLDCRYVDRELVPTVRSGG